MLVYVLGTAQDGGYPQVGCNKKCCEDAWSDNSVKRLPSCIAIVDKEQKKYWLPKMAKGEKITYEDNMC